nr:DUF4283 domain-containing protein [Tanacetum cinerariifolium]
AGEGDELGEKCIEEFPSLAEVYPTSSSTVHTPIACCNKDLDNDVNKKTKNNEHVIVNNSFVKVVKNNNEYKSDLELIPTGFKEGREREDPGWLGISHYLCRNGILACVSRKKDHEIIPLWIKLFNLPLATWSSKGISATASSLGKHVIMDQTTAKMYDEGVGRIGYARLLIEVNAQDNLKNIIEICYKNAKQKTSYSKYVNVVYDWMPPKCEFCKVFGHVHAKPKARQNIEPVKNDGMGKNGEEVSDDNGRNNNERGESKSPTRGWNVDRGLVDALRRSAKYAIFSTVEDVDIEDNHENSSVEEVNKFIKLKKQHTFEETRNWNMKMVKCFKEQWEKLEANELDEEEDVLDEVVALAKSMSANDLYGLNETDELYATNHRQDRRSLLKTLLIYKTIVSNYPWVFMGDWNVSLNVYDHSAGGSSKIANMLEFKECIEKIEVEDLNSFGLHYTRIQSRLNPSSGILNKLDRVLGNNNFMGTFSSTHAIFLPRLSSDHCHVVLIIPNMLTKKRKAFKFVNYFVEKPEFVEVIRK